MNKNKLLVAIAVTAVIILMIFVLSNVLTGNWTLERVSELNNFYS